VKVFLVKEVVNRECDGNRHGSAAGIVFAYPISDACR
jgi:hypothetical protein